VALTPARLFAITWCISCGLIFARNPDALLFPVLHAEDGPFVFQYFYGNRDPASVLRHYEGYLALGPNIVGYLVSFLPVTWVPHALVAVPAGIAAASYSLVTLPGFRDIIASDRQRMSLALGLTILPIGNFALVGSTMYSLWSLLLILVLLTLGTARLPRSGTRRVVFTVLCSILIWSHPLSIVLLPVYALRLWRERAGPDRAVWLFLIVVTGLYVAIGIDLMQANRPVLDLFRVSARAILERVVFETVIGNTARMQLLTAGYVVLMELIALSIVAVMTVPVIRWARTGAIRSRFSLESALVFLLVTLLSVYTRGGHLDDEWAQRYTYIQSALLIILIFAAVFPTLLARPRMIRTLAVTAAITWLVVLARVNAVWYMTDRDEGQRVRQFVRTIDAMERNGASRRLRLERSGAWSIEIEPRPRQ